MILEVVTWNVRKAQNNIKKALRARIGYDIIAIQETGNQYGKNHPICPAMAGYTLIYGEGKTAIYIRNTHGPESWEAEADKDWCSIRMKKYNTKIWNIYNPPTPTGADTPTRVLAALDPDEHNVVLGDLNLHNPIWDTYNRTSEGSNEFVTATERARLELLTPRGECTWYCHGRRNSTIDLIWATHGSPTKYMGSDDELTGSDHVAQRVRLGTELYNQNHPTTNKTKAWKRVNGPVAEAEARNRIRGPWPALETTEQVEAFADDLIEKLLQVADVAVPMVARRATGDRREWKTPEVLEASRKAKMARRKYAADPSEQQWRTLKEAEREESKIITESDRTRWRTTLEEASRDEEKLWALERWARLRSWEQYETPKIPDLAGADNQPIRTHIEKARKLAATFFPEERCGHGPLPGLKEGNPIPIRTQVSAGEVKDALKRIAPWKAPGEDGIPTGFLKACGKAAREAIAHLASGSFATGYFPKRFRAALVIVLRKPGKTPQERRTPKGWRPISLLSTVGKVIEKIMGDRLASVSEEHGLLPEGQMGNRKARSTEAALKVCVESIRTAWRLKGMVSLLLLDISSAFDSVPHWRLLETAKAKGFPDWTCKWIESFLESRSASLRFDGETAPSTPIRAGVPQGSPLSPILFILYIGTLYDALSEVPNIITVGFADDTNILSFGPDAEATEKGLLAAWATCEDWSKKAGLAFNPSKSELIHFTKKHKGMEHRIRTGNVTVTPRKAVKFLGVWMDRKLQWSTHVKETEKKLRRQIRALTGISSSTYGCNFRKARTIYKVAIRSAMAYGASIFHKPTEKGCTPQGPVRSLAKWQASCLRIVTGAYRATPTRLVETEALVPPLDLYLNQRVVATESRFEDGEIAGICRTATRTVVQSLTRQRRRRLRKHTPMKASWYQRQGREFVMEDEWMTRWEKGSRPVRNRLGPMPIAETTTRFDRKALKRHDGLRKHESSVLTQIRTGRIGLRAFLFTRNVPEANTPICRCGEGKEDIYHVVLWCPLYEEQRAPLRSGRRGRPLRERRDVATATDWCLDAKTLVRWVLNLGILEQYKLAEKLNIGADIYRCE